MSDDTGQLWQVSLGGPLARLKAWAAARDHLDDPPWLALSVFDTKPPEGAVQLLFAGRDGAEAFVTGRDYAPDWRVDCARLSDENWVAKSLRGLPVVRAGRFYVYGAHHDAPDDDALAGVLIDAGEAFGSGHHGTTKGCLLAFEDRLDGAAPATVLDLGTGAGTLAIAAAMALPDAVILATDIDPVAVRVARDNAVLNGVAGRIDFFTASGFDHAVLARQRFELIFANILAGPLMAMAGPVCAALDPGGVVLLSGILDRQEEAVRRAYTRSGLAFERHYVLDEWRVLVMRKPV